MTAAGTGNCVIVGRGSQHVLADRLDTLRVFLYAPREDKVRRVIARGKTEAEAIDLVDTVDRDRVDFIQKYFHVEWPSRSLYHLMINTSVGEEMAVQTILNFMKTLDAENVASLHLR
jgi:cytidylate kinase